MLFWHIRMAYVCYAKRSVVLSLFLGEGIFYCRFSVFVYGGDVMADEKLSKAVAMLCEKYEQLWHSAQTLRFYSKRSLLYKAEAGSVDKGA